MTDAADQFTDDLAARAVSLAETWISESAGVEEDAAAARLAGVLKDPNGLPFTIGFVDGVMRPESLAAAAANLHRVAPLVPEFLPWYLRGAVRTGGAVAPVLPAPTVPVARRALREMVGHLIVDARPDRLGPALERIRAGGSRLNLNLLGEAVLGEAEARRRLDGIHDLIRRDDVDYVSVKVSAIVSRISMWAFDEVVDDVVERLRPLYLTAAENGTFINLDMEEYRDLDLTIAVFRRVLGDERLRQLEAGIVLQAYLPDALDALAQLTDWAQERVSAGGAGIKVRLVKGANLAMERVDATLHGWDVATHASKLDADASYLRCLDAALTPERTAAVRIGVAGHNLYDVAYAWELAGERNVRHAVEFEMLLGMAQGQVEAVSREVGAVLLYVPVVRPDEFDVAISYLVRRLEENASEENFLSAAFDLADDPELRERERERFRASIARAGDPDLPATPRRRQDRTQDPADARPALTKPDVSAADEDEVALTQAVLAIAADEDDFVETAVFALHETPADGGAPGFRNAPDTDPSRPENRRWAREILERVEESTQGLDTVARSELSTTGEVDTLLRSVAAAAADWGARPARERGDVLRAAARVLEERRAELIEVAVAETGKVLSEADTEVSEAIDFAAYYAATAAELDRVAGARFEPSRVTVIAPPWNFPIAIPAGGMLAALAAGSGVVVKPAPQAERCAAVVVEALWEAGVPRDVLTFVTLDEDALGRHLMSHPSVDRVILTGSWDTAQLFRSWRPALPLLAETSGKNTMIVMPSADMDLAVSDLVKSAFGHAGQKCSAASLVILVGPVARSRRFARQLVDAVESLRIGPPTDPRNDVGPLIEPPRAGLDWALTTLDEGERWLVEPRALDEERRYWSPGVRLGVRPGSRFHREEFFGPVLGVMHASSLSQAIEMQNAVDFGLTAGLQTQDPDDLALWLDEVAAGNLYVNRGTTGAIVQRQPFGGWKRSAVGPGTKAGGPNYLIGLGRWRATSGAAQSSTLHLRGLDTRITDLIEAAQPTLDYDAFEWLRRGALSDAIAWDREFGRVKDVSGLGVERNLLRYRPVPVAIRAVADATWQAVLRTVIAGVRAGSEITLSAPVGLPGPVRRALAELDITVFVETAQEWAERWIASDPVRVRLVGSAESTRRAGEALAVAADGDPDLAVYDDEVTTAGRIELLPFLREQSVTITAHRFGNPDAWSAAVV